MKPDPLLYRPEVQGWSEDIIAWYSAIVPNMPAAACVVELGVYHGRSTLFMAESLWAAGNHDARVYAVDTWGRNGPTKWNWTSSDYDTFVGHLNATGDAGLLVDVCPFDSGEFAEKFADSQCDLVFLDASHEYEDVRRDIQAWLPKVKPGGMLAGHDYGGDHPGVVRAVDEAMIGRTVGHFHSVWWVTC